MDAPVKGFKWIYGVAEDATFGDVEKGINVAQGVDKILVVD
jgi:hypothetical protein